MKIIITEGQLNTIKMDNYCNFVLRQMIDDTKWEDASFSKILLGGKNVSTALSHDMDRPYYFYIPDAVADHMNLMGIPDYFPCEEYVWGEYSDYVIKMYLSKKRR